MLKRFAAPALRRQPTVSCVAGLTVLRWCAVAAVALVLGCGGDNGVNPGPDPLPDPDPGPVPEVDEALRYNEVAFKEVHNSYQRHVPFETALSWDPDHPWKYGAGCVEIDTRIDRAKYLQGEWDWSVSHIYFEDDPAKNFGVYLERLEQWSLTHPGHRVVTLQIDAKDKESDDLFMHDREAYSKNLPAEMDAYIAKHFDTSLLYRPRDLMAGYPDLVTRVRTEGWPTLGELRGKFIFVFGITYDNSTKYSDQDAANRLCFGMARFWPDPENSIDVGNRVFFQYDIRTHELSPEANWFERAQFLRSRNFVLRGLNICQDADEDGDPDCQKHLLDNGEASDGLELWSLASAAGLNLISTDLVDEEDWATVGTMPLWPIAVRNWGPCEASSLEDSDGPALARFGGELCAIYVADGNLKCSSWNGASWQAPAVSAHAAQGKAAAVEFDGRLWAVARDVAGDLYSSSVSNGAWASRTEIDADAMDGAGVAVYGGRLYAIYPDYVGRLAYATSDGAAWSEPVLAKGTASHAPAVAVAGGLLYAVYRDDEGRTYVTNFDGETWDEPRSITDLNGVRMAGAPVAAVIGDRLEILFRDRASDDIHYFSILQSGHVSGQARVLGGSSSSELGLAVFGDQVGLIHADGDGGALCEQWLSID